MPLNIDALYPQVEEMAVDAPDMISGPQLLEARECLRTADTRLLRHELEQRERGTAKIPWLVAEPVDTLSSIFQTPPVPTDFTVAAADGSSIPPDRHSPMRYFVLNVGHAALTYGRTPKAVLDAQEQFCFAEISS